MPHFKGPCGEVVVHTLHMVLQHVDLQENPDISENLARMSEERETLVLLLEKTLTDLRDGHYASLVNFVEREHDTREKMRAVATKEEEVMRDVEQLTAKLKEEDEKHAAEMENKRLSLNDLKEKLRKLKIDTTLTLRYARKEAAAKTESTARFYTAEESDILTQIEAIKHKMDMENAVHAEEMELLRRGLFVFFAPYHPLPSGFSSEV
jgi:signal-transduction protein with cAMP-binding, CBS, and nucleotidyltransferase domain